MQKHTSPPHSSIFWERYHVEEGGIHNFFS